MYVIETLVGGEARHSVEIRMNYKSDEAEDL